MRSLERADPTDEFAAATLATMRKRSPTSLAVAFRAINAGQTLSMDECMQMEFRILNRMLEGHDFYEGIRAVIIDKGADAALATRRRWKRSTPATIDAYFAPLGRRRTQAVSRRAQASGRSGRQRRKSPSTGSTALIAAYCLLFGVLYWIRLIGYYAGPLWRFDLMPVHWRVAGVMLAAFFPFAAIGLWMLASWGPVIWFICAVRPRR